MMFCITCNEVHQHPTPANLRSGSCMCTYLGHEVRDATPDEEAGVSYERRMYNNLMKALGE